MGDFFDDILTCGQSAIFEREYFKSGGRSEFEVISLMGERIAESLLGEFGALLGGEPEILVLAGKGHNAADALACALELLKARPRAKISLVLTSKLEELKPNTAELARRLLGSFGHIFLRDISTLGGESFDLILDGILGMSFRRPLGGAPASLIGAANSLGAKIRASIDLPSGLCDESCEGDAIFRADVCYMTGIAKAPLFDSKNFKYSGRLRYIDAGFFNGATSDLKFALTSDRILEPLKRLRSFDSDKRSYGHLFIFGGSADFPGAVLMNVKAALRAGVGLVSAFVPESVARALAAAEPACIWVPCPEDFYGGLALESFADFKRFAGSQTAILAGSGLGSRPEPLALISEIANKSDCPLVLDADAIRPEILKKLSRREVLITPHMGEFARVGGSLETLAEFCRRQNLTTLLKAPLSRVCDGGRLAFTCSGGPMLSRAGSGDVLAGFAAGLLARKDLKFDAFTAAACASHLLGKCSQRAFAKRGESAFSNSELFNFIGEVLND